MSKSATTVLLLRACHLEPTVAVAVLAGVLAASVGNEPATLALLVIAVLSGQLVIGWSNDLLDVARDRQVERGDKPLATGALSARTVHIALSGAALVCVVASLLGGLWSGAVHLVLLVGSGLAYNLGLKRTVLSWLPYAVAFGSLPSVVTLALDQPVVAPVWMTAAGALLGVGAHLVNVIPDLDDDAATGVRGLPHVLGRRWSLLGATLVLVAASVAAALGPPGAAPLVAWVGLALVVVLAVGTLLGSGRTPMRGAIAIALVDVLMLTLAG